jgi:hypothetical protein
MQSREPLKSLINFCAGLLNRVFLILYVHVAILLTAPG